MRGGYNGVRERNGDRCTCGHKYDRYVPADDDFEPNDTDVERICIVVNDAGYASGGYVHFTLENEETGPVNNANRRHTRGP